MPSVTVRPVTMNYLVVDLTFSKMSNPHVSGCLSEPRGLNDCASSGQFENLPGHHGIGKSPRRQRTVIGS